ncbi:hypothetical protein ACOSQ2_000284 [Xanthoceras sorbifolium]
MGRIVENERRRVLLDWESSVVVPNKSVSSRNGGAESHNSGGGIFTKNLLDKVVAIVASGNGVSGTKVVKVPVEALAISDEANQELHCADLATSDVAF